MSARTAVRVLLVVIGLSVAGCASLEPLPAGVDGVWKARRPGGGDEIRLDLYLGPAGHRDTHRYRFWADFDDIEGLDETSFLGAEPLAFVWNRDAGSLHFEGVRGRRPSGSFRFEPTQEFQARMRQLGVEELERDALLEVAIHGISTDLLDALLAAGYRGGDLDDLLRLDRYGLRADWVQSMARLAGPPSLPELISLRNYGVSATQVDGWIAAGMDDLPVDDLLRLYLHGFRAADATIYRELGFEDVDGWLTFHRNGVPSDLITAVVETGGPELDVEGVVRLYVHGVRPADVREARTLIDAGYDWDQLVYLWRRGIDTGYAEALVQSGWDDLDEEAIARLAANGVDEAWALQVRAGGGDALDIEELVRLRHYGVRADDYTTFANEGMASIDDIRILVASGVPAEWVQRVHETMQKNFDAEQIVRLHQNDVNLRLLERLHAAGFTDLDVGELIEARQAGVDRWLERREP